MKDISSRTSSLAGVNAVLRRRSIAIDPISIARLHFHALVLLQADSDCVKAHVRGWRMEAALISAEAAIPANSSEASGLYSSGSLQVQEDPK